MMLSSREGRRRRASATAGGNLNRPVIGIVTAREGRQRGGWRQGWATATGRNNTKDVGDSEVES